MKTLRYLNSILTVIAVLLTINVYVQLTGTPAGTTLSVATEAQAADKNPKRGVGATAAREAAQLEELKAINVGLDRLAASLTNGSIKVQVESMPEIGD